MKNTTDLRNELVKVFKDLKARKIDTGAAKAIIGLSNSILKTATSEADYNKFLGRLGLCQIFHRPFKISWSSRIS